jgi:class 3 adenylate cyclase
MTAAAPSGVVTFLFTDIEGSTRRWEADADAMRKALAAHGEVLRAAIEGHDGWRPVSPPPAGWPPAQTFLSNGCLALNNRDRWPSFTVGIGCRKGDAVSK